MLAAFRRELYRCFSKRPDGLAELADAVLCKPDRVHMAAELSLVPECRRGHGAVYDAVNSGRVQIGRLRRSLAALPFPARADGRIRRAADVSNWLAWLLTGLPAGVLGRLRSDRVLFSPAPARGPGTNGRPARHGAAVKLADRRSWPDPPVTTVTETARYGTAAATARGRLHQRLTSRAGWEDNDGKLPVIEGTLIPLHVTRLPGNRSPGPL